jgi:hypothetical protein
MIRIILIVLIAIAAVGAGWLLRDRWNNRDAGAIVADTAVMWEPLTTAGADRARRSIEALGQSGSRVFVNVSPGDLSSHIFLSLSRKLPPSAEDIEAAAIDDRLHVRATVRTSDFGGAGALGALGGFLGEREFMQLGGYFHVVRPGLAEYRVTDLRVGTITIPEPLIPRLITRFSTGARPEGVAPNGLPLEIPEYIADVRVAGALVVLYRDAR